MMIDQLSKTTGPRADFIGEQTTKKMTGETISFTSDLFQRVTAAVFCSLNPNTENQEKQFAVMFLDDLKENNPLISLTIGLELLKQQSAVNVSLLHHYGLHLIESIVKYKWTQLKTDEKSFVREQLFLMIKSSSLNQTFMEPTFIRNALARCLVEMIKRDCFEKVNVALDEVISMTQGLAQTEDRNITQVELVLLVYRFLNEELTIYAQTVQAHRRRQLLNQLQKRLNDLLPCLIRFANDFLSLTDQYERLNQTCLLAVNSFLTWVDYNHFEQYELFLCDLFLKFFQLPAVKLRHASFECLLSLVNKRLARRQLQQQQQQRNKRIALSPSAALNCQQEKLFLNYFLSDNTLEIFYRLLLSPTDSIEQLRTIVTNDHLNCLKMLGQLLVKLANYLLQLFQLLATKSIDDDQFLSFVNERTRSFLQFLLLLNQHPFHLLSLNSYQALNAFISRQPTLLSNEQFCLKLVENLKQSLHRVHFSSSSTITTSTDTENETLKKQYLHNQQSFVYALFEYDSEEQFFWKFFSQYRTELQKLIKSFVGMFFPDTFIERSMILETNMSCLRSILQQLLSFLESLVQRTPRKIDSQMQTPLSSIYLIIEWEAFYLLFDHVLFIIRKELFSSSMSTIKSRQEMERILMIPAITEQFLRILTFLLQFTPDLSEHIHGHVLNLLSVMFFITKHDSSLAIQIIQRLLQTFRLNQEKSIAGISSSECEIMQTQASNAFLYLCKNFTVKMMDYYAELFPFVCQLYKDDFQLTKNPSSIIIEDSTCPTLKLLDAAQTLLYHKFTETNNSEQNEIDSFYQLVKPIYDTLVSCLTVDSLAAFIQQLDLAQISPMNMVQSQRRNLMLALHCLCLLIRYSKQQQHLLNPILRVKIATCLRPILFDYIIKVTQFCNELYDQQLNPFYELMKVNLTYSDTEKQLYLGTYESNNIAKVSITSTTTTSSLPVNFVRFQTNITNNLDDQRLRDYFHRLFDICYQINGMFFAHDPDLYHLKLNDDCYFLSQFLQKILFANLNTLPSFRLRIVLRQFCRSFVEHYCSITAIDKEIMNELFLTFLDLFLPYIQQRLTSMWTNLLNTTTDYQQGEYLDEVIEECVCVLLTRDFVDLIRFFIYKSILPGSIQFHTSSQTQNKKKNRMINGYHHNESMCEDINGTINADADPIDEWDEQSNTNSVANKFLNGSQEKLDYSDLFMYMMKMSRQNSSLSLRLTSYVIKALFECLTFPDAYCVNRFLPIILPLTKLSSDIIDKLVQSSLSIDIQFLFQCLLKGLERHNENEGVNTNMISLIGHIYELWYEHYQLQLDSALNQTVPQLNIELLNSYKARMTGNHDQQKRAATIAERERRDTFKNLLSPLLLSSTVTANKKEGLTVSNVLNQSNIISTF